MENLISKKGKAVITAGRGYISLQEAQNLQTGIVIRSNAIAGKPFPL
jgi:hypothetical protein